MSIVGALPALHLSPVTLAKAARARSPSLISNGSVPPAAVSKILFAKEKQIISTVWETRVKERTYDLNLVTNQMDVYEPLLDDYLSDYFQNPKIRNHLKKLGMIDENGEIIDDIAFKYKLIKFRRKEYERNVLKRAQERDLDREIEVAIRSKIKNEKVKTQERYQKQKMNNPETQIPKPEFLSQYPVSMWRTALLYAQRPPSLTHVGGVKRRSITHPQIQSQQTDSERIYQRFSTARKQFEDGDIDSAKSTLCEIIALIRERGRTSSFETLEGNHNAVSNAIQKAIEKAAINLTGSERLLIGYIHKLGGQVDTVIKYIQQGRYAAEIEKTNFEVQQPKSKSSSTSSIRSVGRGSTSQNPVNRPQSARPTRASQFPSASSFSSILGSLSAPNVPQLNRPNSARKTRESKFSPGSNFSMGGDGEINESDVARSVHFSRPTSARPSRVARFPVASEFSSDIGLSECEEIYKDDVNDSNSDASFSGDQVHEMNDQAEIVQNLDYEEFRGQSKVSEELPSNTEEDTKTIFEVENTDENDCVNEDNEIQQNVRESKSQATEKVTSHRNLMNNLDKNDFGENYQIFRLSKTESEFTSQDLKETVVIKTVQNEKEIPKKSDSEQITENYATECQEQDETNLFSSTFEENPENKEVGLENERNGEISKEETNSQDNYVDIDDFEGKNISNQDAIKLGSAFLTQKDLESFFQDSNESFMFGITKTGRSDSEIRSLSSKKGSLYNSIASFKDDLEAKRNTNSAATLYHPHSNENEDYQDQSEMFRPSSAARSIWDDVFDFANGKF
ncbi:hypothetical protein HK100_006464 [Physocladia obscura]|uniref:Uncharacterized protein n=1 Tax=Physocladia obscura TaxID=109957 RepID=A0AAD5TG46_9FUNG|nr:hypothetical protein HK100_006464 [Physocladia obscura]